MKLTILGCSSAFPEKDSSTSSQLLEINGKSFLIDCGEGTQIQLRKYGVKLNSIENIFISHLHGDHFFGLPGLISTLKLLGRTKALNIYGPTGIKKAITLLLKLGGSWTNYDLHFHELNSTESIVILENSKFKIQTIPLNHRIYTNGFLFTEIINEQKLLIQNVEKYKIDKTQYRGIKLGKDGISLNGELIKNSLLTEPKEEDKSYAYCSDTCFFPKIIPIIKNSTVLYHESTFLESHKKIASMTKHSTAREAAEIAKQANVATLILGHFSSRYNDIEGFKTEAESVFSNVELSNDGKIFNI
jgi:ribonuclease Z|tara:strand:+ start:80659 stop:81564 length:906 start_codon:yes stop_codon:yes gene_type:complete